MKRKKLLIIALLAVLLGCSNKDNKVKIGVLFPHASNNKQVIWAQVADQFRSLATGGIEVVVKAAGQDAKQQQQQAEELFSQDVDVLILAAVNVNTGAAIIREAHERDIPVIAYDSMLPNSLPDFYISFKYKMAGELMAEYALKRKPEGDYVLLWGDRSHSVALTIKEGQLAHLQPHTKTGAVNILYRTHISDWTLTNSQKQMEKVLTHTTDTIDAVLASNDRIAEGAYRALKQYNLADSAVITGMDADLAACQRIAEGKQSCTVYKSFIRQSKVAYQAAVKFANNQKPKSNITVSNNAGNIPARMLKPVLVHKNNLIETVIKDGLYTRKEVFGNAE